MSLVGLIPVKAKGLSMVSVRRTEICRVSMLAVKRGRVVRRGAQLFTTGAKRLDSKLEMDARVVSACYCAIHQEKMPRLFFLVEKKPQRPPIWPTDAMPSLSLSFIFSLRLPILTLDPSIKNGAGDFQMGACEYPYINSAMDMIAALNKPDFGKFARASKSPACGQCLQVVGPNGTVTVQVVDMVSFFFVVF